MYNGVHFVSNVRRYMFTLVVWDFQVRRMIYWSSAGCTPSFTAELSALERITAVEKKLDCVDSLIREVTMLRNEIALIKKPELTFLKAAKRGTQQESK